MAEMNNHKDREHALLSASSAHRWLACPPSAVAAEAYPEQDSEYTREGTLAHEVAEWVVSGKSKTQHLDKGQDDGITSEMLECAVIYRDYIQEMTTDEAPLVLLEQRVDFSPWVPDGFGTCDCILIQRDPLFPDTNTMTVIDYKYGQGVAVSAKDNPQLKLYALGALNDYGFAYNVTSVEMHIFQPRIGNISVDKMPVADLIEWADSVVKPTAQKAAKGTGTYKEGMHCTFCPHAGRCRKLSQVCKEFVETHDLRVAVPVLAPHEIAAVLQMEPLIELWLRRIKTQALNQMMNGGEVPGYKVVAGRGRRAWADDLEAAAVLDKAGYSREEYTKTELLSPSQMEKALGKKKVTELLGGHILTSTGSPTIAPETDRRPTYDPATDFEIIKE